MRKKAFLIMFFFIVPLLAPTAGLKAEEADTVTEDIESENSSLIAATESLDGSEGTFTPMEGSGEVPEDQRIMASAAGLDEKVSLDLRNIEVTEALRFLAQKSGMNMVISKNVKGRAQLLLTDVPIRDVLDILLITNGLASEKRGDIYYVMSEAEYKERFGRKFSDTRKVKVFRLKYAVPDQAFSLLEVLKSEIGRLLVDPESGTVLVMDSEENIQRMETALAGLEEKRIVKIYSLQYAKAIDIESRLKSELDDKKVGVVKADERTNQLIVQTLPDRLPEIDRMIKSLDQKTKEVLIDAKIIKVIITNDMAAEIKWEGLLTKAMKGGTGFIGNHPFSPVFRTATSFIDDFRKIEPTSNPPRGAKNVLSENLFLGQVDRDDAYEVLINFLKTLGDTKVLSNPKLAVVNNEEAKIHVGEKQAYVTTTTTTGQTTTTTAESVTFIDVGIKLSVTPTINDDGYVTMKIKPEVSSVVDFLITPSGNKIPIVDSTLAETSVVVKDGVSIIIGGLRKDEKVNTTKRVPFLGDVPILGIPFNSRTSVNHRTELLILMTPHIVQGDTLVDGYDKVGDKPVMAYTDYDYGNVPMENLSQAGKVKGVTVRT